jgi:phenol hydroxylase P5 protein
MGASSCEVGKGAADLHGGRLRPVQPASMILDLLGEGCELPITLVYGQRSRAELYYHDEFLALAEAIPTSPTCRPCRTKPADSDWPASAASCTTRPRPISTTTSVATRPTCAARRHDDRSLHLDLMQGRLFENDIYTEKFFSAADAQQVRSPLFKRV